ncbi:MAG: cell division FtsA domain-containing protein, partial [Aristaeellaceae bacterium]
AWFMVDDGKKTLEPVGMKGRELSAMISFVVASQFFVDELTNRLTDIGVTACGFYSTPAGEAMLYLPEEERDRTAVLIDIGYLNTEVMAVEGDALIFHKTIEIGGGDIAADLAIGLDIPLKEAEEKIKRQYVYGIATKDESYDLPGVEGQKPRSFTRDEVTEIITARVDEMAEEIQQALEDSGIKLGNWSNIYLTGGGLSFNRGGKDYLSGKLGRTVRDTPKRTTKMNSHAFSSTLGLMDLIIDTVEQQHQPSAGVGGAVKDFFRSLLGG